jgi:hypothetical protein
MRPEIELLLCCTRTQTSMEDRQRITALAQRELNWTLVSQAAFFHFVTPVLYQNLAEICPEKVPEAMLTLLWARYEKNLRRNKLLTGTLVRIAKVFADNGLTLVAFKGPVLACAIYGHYALREFVDLDILVRRSDFARAAELLSVEGFKPPFDSNYPTDDNFFTNTEALFADADGASIDIHWQLLPKEFPFAPSVEDVLTRATTVALGDGNVLTLSADDLLLMLCAHGAKHGWSQLNWICDVAETVCASPEINWQVVLERAGKLRSERMLLLGLRLANILLGTTLPQEVSLRIEKSAMVKSLSAHVIERLFKDPDGRSAPSRTLHLKTIESWRDRARYLFVRGLPTFEDWKFLRLPRALFPLYYPLRPIRYGIGGCQQLIETIVK